MIKTYFYSFIILCLLSLYISLTCNLKAPCIYLSISYMHYRLSNPFGSSQDIFPSDSRINNNRFISSKIWTLCLSVYRYHSALGSQSLIDHSDNNSQRCLHINVTGRLEKMRFLSDYLILTSPVFARFYMISMVWKNSSHNVVCAVY